MYQGSADEAAVAVKLKVLRECGDVFEGKTFSKRQRGWGEGWNMVSSSEEH